MPTDNSERPAKPIRRESPHGLLRNLLRTPLARDREQSLSPSRHKYRRCYHGLTSRCAAHAA
jgi:hypothetical protein